MKTLKIIVVLMVTVLLASCASNTYLSRNDKLAMLASLEQKIDQQVGGQYGSLILKLDLLQLEQVNAKLSDQCPISPIYAALDSSAVTRDQFEQMLLQLEARFEQKLQRNLLRDTLYRTTDKKITKLKNLIRGTNITSDALRHDAVASAETLDLILNDVSGPQGGPYIPAAARQGGADSIGLFSKLAYLDSISIITDSIPIVSPLPQGRLTSGFSVRKDPISRKNAIHEGLDFVGGENAKVLSAASGKVIYSDRFGAYGNLVIIDHGFGITTRYAHLQKIFVQKGEKVGIGQSIGIQGNSGRTTGAHLHYEVRFKDKARNPALFLRYGNGCVLGV